MTRVKVAMRFSSRSRANELWRELNLFSYFRFTCLCTLVSLTGCSNAHAQSPIRAIDMHFCLKIPQSLDYMSANTTLRKHTYSNIKKISPKKNSDIFHISAQNIDFGYSLEPPRRVPTICVFEQIKKNNLYPCKPQFHYIKMGFKGVKII